MNVELKSTDFPTSAKVGVIMTSYGRDTLLEKAIKSVLNQSMRNFILFIIDDNSPRKNDKTQPIIEKYDKIDNGIVYLTTDTEDADRASVNSFTRNINQVIKFIKDNDINIQYVCYLPCDDFFYPQRLETACSFLDTQSSINSCFTYVKRSGPKTSIINGSIPADPRQKPVKNPVTVLDHSTVTHRFNLLHKIADPIWPTNKKTEAIAPDGEFFLKLVKAGGPIFCASRKILGEKTMHKDSIQGRFYRW